jgi:hypothetical protein
MGVPRSIETRNKIHAGMAVRWTETKKTVLFVFGGKRPRKPLLFGGALQTIVFPGTGERDKRSHRRAGNNNPERSLPND